MLKRMILIIMVLIIFMISWEGSLEAKGIIPEDSIRIRILANSDSVPDQWIKRQVRNAIIEQIQTWEDHLQGKDLVYARQFIDNQRQTIEEIAESSLQRYGFPYGAKVYFGNVHFPAKQYGNRIYAEQDYEALLIVLGEGAGQNWWCVLFPPLCFIDGTTSKDYPQNSVNKSVDKNDKTIDKQENIHNAVENASKSINIADETQSSTGKIKTKLFFVELWKKWF